MADGAVATASAAPDGAASTGLIEHLLSEIRELRSTVTKLSSAQQQLAAGAPPPVPAAASPSAAALSSGDALYAASDHGGDVHAAGSAPSSTRPPAAAAVITPEQGAPASAATATAAALPASPATPGTDPRTLADKLATQTQLLRALPGAVRPKTVPMYFLPWVVTYARRLADGHHPFGLEEEDGAVGDAAAAGPAGGDHVTIVKQWSDMFEAALTKHLCEDRFDTVNVQMCEAVLCIAQRNFFRNPLHIAAVFTKVVRASGNGRYKARLAELGFAAEYATDANFLDLVAAVCRADAAADAAQRAVVDAHLQQKIQAYMQCKQWRRQLLRQRLRDTGDGGGGGGGGGADSDAATGVAEVLVRLSAADYIDSKVEALRRVGDARALIATGLVHGMVAEAANSASPAFRTALVEDSANHPTVVSVLGPGVALTAANCGGTVAAIERYLQGMAQRFVEREADRHDDPELKDVGGSGEGRHKWQRKKRKAQWGRYHHQVDSAGHELHHGAVCRLRRCRFYGLDEHAYKAEACLYWCQSDTCKRAHPHRFRYKYCVLGEAWDPLL